MDLLKARLPLAVVVSAILSVGGLALSAGRALAQNAEQQQQLRGRVDALESTISDIHDGMIEIRASQRDQRDRLVRVEGKIDEMQRGR